MGVGVISARRQGAPGDAGQPASLGRTERRIGADPGLRRWYGA